MILFICGVCEKDPERGSVERLSQMPVEVRGQSRMLDLPEVEWGCEPASVGAGNPPPVLHKKEHHYMLLTADISFQSQKRIVD